MFGLALLAAATVLVSWVSRPFMQAIVEAVIVLRLRALNHRQRRRWAREARRQARRVVRQAHRRYAQFEGMYAMPVVADFIFSSGVAGLWIQLVNNLTGATFTSVAPSTGVGLFTVSGGPPPAGDYTLNTSLVNGAPWTLRNPHYPVPTLGQADTNFPTAGPNPKFDVTHPKYGAVSGAADVTAAINGAIADAKAAGGGIIAFPGVAGGPAVYNYTQLNLDDTRGIIFEGPSVSNSGIGTGVKLNCTLSASALTAISARSCMGVVFRGLTLTWSNLSWTGTLVDYGQSVAQTYTSTGAIRPLIEHSFIGGPAGSTNLCLDWDQTILPMLDDVTFGNCGVGVRGKKTVGSFAQNARLKNVDWVLGGCQTALIKNPAESWSLESCNFEALANGRAAGIVLDPGFSYIGLTIDSPWMGDVTDTTTPNAWIQFAGQGLTIKGGLSGAIGGNQTTFVKYVAAADGLAILGHSCIGCLNYIDFGAGLAGGSCCVLGGTASVVNFTTGTVPKSFLVTTNGVGVGGTPPTAVSLYLNGDSTTGEVLRFISTPGARTWTLNEGGTNGPVAGISFKDLVTGFRFDIDQSGHVFATGKFWPGSSAGGAPQTSGGISYGTSGAPSNANGQNGDYCLTTNSHIYFRTGGVWIDLIATVNSMATPANPVGTASAAGVMMGLAGTITPIRTGTIEVTISGDIFNNTIADGASVQIRYGTGTAPANGVALTGTAIGAKPAATAAAASEKAPFSITVIISGLTLGVAVWLDLALAAVTGGTATAENLTIAAKEI